MSEDSDEKKINLTEVWPQERDYMTRPDRMRYVRQLKSKSDECVFCAAIKKQQISIDTLVIFKSEHSAVFLNKFPYNVGHLLVVPLSHGGDLESLDAGVMTDLSLVLQKCVKILKKEYGCAGLNVGLNLGDVAGAGIPQHLHWHVIPRWFGDTNFFPLIAETKVQVEDLAQTFARLTPHFS